MRGYRRLLVLAATGTIWAAGQARAQDVDEPMPEPQHSQLPPGAVVQPIDTGPGAELRRNLMTLAENPRSLEALIGAGRAAITLRDGEGASGFFTRAQEIAPDDPRVKSGLASAMLLSGRPEQALILFAEAVQRGAPAAEIAGDRGLAYDMVGDPRHAQQDYALALRRRNDPEIERRLALSLAISGQRDAALRVIDAQLRRHDRAAWRTEAFVLALTGDPAGADDTARRLMPAPNAAALAPFFARLASLSPAQKAAAVNFGRFPSDGRTRTASNADTRADPGALAYAQGGLRAQPPLADPVNSSARRRADPGEPRADSLIRRRRGDEVAPPVTPQRRVEIAQGSARRFEPAPQPGADDEEEDKTGDDAQEPATQPRYPVARPREAPAFVPGGNFTLDTSHEEARPQPPAAPATPVAPGFSIGPVQPSVNRFQSVTTQPAAPAPAMSDVTRMVQALPTEDGAAPASPPVPALSPAERQARDAAARAAEERYRQSGSAPGRAASAASGRHWVQIAHLPQRGALAGQYREVRARAPSLVDSRSAWTVADRGTNRLLLGPFDSARAAQDYIDQLSARRIAAIPWESAGQSVERLQEGPSSAPSRARAERPEPRSAATSRTARSRQAADDDDRRPVSRRTGRNAASDDERRTAHGRAGRNASASNDERGSSRARSARDRSDERGSPHARSGRPASDDRSNARGRNGGRNDEDRGNRNGRSNTRRGADDDRSASRSRTAHGRAASDDSSRTSRNRSSQEGRQAAHDTRNARGRSSAEQRPAPPGRRSR